MKHEFLPSSVVVLLSLCMFDWQVNKQQIARIRLEAMFYANAATSVDMARDIAEDTRTEGRRGCAEGYY